MFFPIPFPKRLSLSLLGAVASMDHVYALDIEPGFEHVVRPGDAVTSYQVMSAKLTVQPGAQTNEIAAHLGSTVTISGARVEAAVGSAVDLFGSTATISNSVLSGIKNPAWPNSSSFGLRLNGRTGHTRATVINSQVSGVGRGASVTGDASLILDHSDVLGSDGDKPVGPVAGGVGVFLYGAQAEASNASTITGDNHGVVMISENMSEGMRDPYLKLDGSSVVGTQGSAVVVSGFQGVRHTTADIDVVNGSTLTGGNGIILQVQDAAGARFNVNDSHLTGNVQVSDDSTADLSMVNNASLTGNIANATSLSVDQSSGWVMEGDSTIGKLDVNGGSVDLRGTSDGFHTLTVDALSGSGTFALGTDLAAQQGDALNVAGSATGAHRLLVQNSGINPLEGAAPQQVVHTGSGDAQFSLIGDKVDFGTYAYQLEQQENAAGGTDWSLVQSGEVSAGSRSVIGLFSAAPTVWYGESASLRSRMGELRNGKDQGGGWMRAYGNKYNMSAGGGVAYKQNQQGLSFGADAPLPSSNGQWLAGLMGGYSQSDLDLQEGTTGKVDSYYLGAYTTWLADDGFYVDALIKANRFQNSSDVVMRDGEKSKGDYTNHGVGASVEAGKHIKLNEQWFVEPFAQVSGLWVSGQDYDLDNGMEASSNQADSLLGKVGTQVGRKYALDDGGFVQLYVKVAAAHEFVSSNQVSINENRFHNDLSGTRGELGAGVAAQLTDVLSVHADVDYMKGSNIEQPWGVNVGVRYNW
jgi:outer membrane autotransporter protein